MSQVFSTMEMVTRKYKVQTNNGKQKIDIDRLEVESCNKENYFDELFRFNEEIVFNP